MSRDIKIGDIYQDVTEGFIFMVTGYNEHTMFEIAAHYLDDSETGRVTKDYILEHCELLSRLDK